MAIASPVHLIMTLDLGFGTKMLGADRDELLVDGGCEILGSAYCSGINNISTDIATTMSGMLKLNDIYFPHAPISPTPTHSASP